MNLITLLQRNLKNLLPSMNQRGNLIILIVAAFLILGLIVPLVMWVFKPADFIMRIILVLMIFSTVRGYLGGGILTIVAGGVITYILVIKYAYLTAALYVFFFVFLYLQILSVLIWGLGTTIGPKLAMAQMAKKAG